MKNSEVPMMALRRAVQICNGLDSLGDALNVSMQICNGLDSLGDALNVSSDALERMLAGEEEVPLAVFTQAVGLLLEASATRQPKRRTPDSNEGGRKGPRH
jgi:hypothetical protein